MHSRPAEAPPPHPTARSRLCALASHAGSVAVGVAAGLAAFLALLPGSEGAAAAVPVTGAAAAIGAAVAAFVAGDGGRRDGG